MPVGRIWNVRHNKMYEVRIKHKGAFLNDVIETITKGYVHKFIPAEQDPLGPLGLAAEKVVFGNNLPADPFGDWLKIMADKEPLKI